MRRCGASAEPALYYVDSSALVKLVRREPESDALAGFVVGAALVSSEIALVELPRAIRRVCSSDPSLPVEALIARAASLLDALALRALDRDLLRIAGALAEPRMRALDAIHVAAAVDVFPHEGFITYDDRQAAAARLTGMRTFSPGTS